MEEKKGNYGRKTLTENQEKFCKLVAFDGMKPLDAMLDIFPNRKSYSKTNQTRLAREMEKNPKIIERLKELYIELRENVVVGELYNFDRGVRLLDRSIKEAEKLINDGVFNEAIHRIILSSVQELNRMYGFNLVDKNGKSTNSLSITFVDEVNVHGKN